MDVRKFGKPKVTANHPASPSTSAGTTVDGVPTMTEKDFARNSEASTQVSKQSQDYSTKESNPRTDSNSAIKDYLEYLQENDITDEDIHAVLDTLVTSGDVYWEFLLFNKTRVVFHVRPAWVTDILMRELEDKVPSTYARYHGIIAMTNLAGSIVQIGEKQFDAEDEESLFEVKKYLSRKPFVVQNHLTKKLALFDRLIAVATSDEFIENFTRPQSEEQE